MLPRTTLSMLRSTVGVADFPRVLEGSFEVEEEDVCFRVADLGGWCFVDSAVAVEDFVVRCAAEGMEGAAS